jgi:predicted alpha/beta-fold hydrolase
MVSDFSSFVKLHLEKMGGHMGYLTAKKTPLNSMRWMDYALDEFVKALV